MTDKVTDITLLHMHVEG